MITLTFVSPINVVGMSGRAVTVYDKPFSLVHSIVVTTPADSNCSNTFNSGATIQLPGPMNLAYHAANLNPAIWKNAQSNSPQPLPMIQIVALWISSLSLDTEQDITVPLATLSACI